MVTSIGMVYDRCRKKRSVIIQRRIPSSENEAPINDGAKLLLLAMLYDHIGELLITGKIRRLKCSRHAQRLNCGALPIRLKKFFQRF